MDEDEFKEAYLSLNSRVCVFEKVILSRQCDCRRAARIFIAERQAIGCDTEAARAQCGELLNVLRGKASFALGLTAATGRLPHAKEMKVQAGGLLGLQHAIEPQSDATTSVNDVDALVTRAKTQYAGFEQLPYSEIVQTIAAYQGRPRSR